MLDEDTEGIVKVGQAPPSRRTGAGALADLKARLDRAEREAQRWKIKAVDMERKLRKAEAGGDGSAGPTVIQQMVGPVEAQRLLDCSRGNRSLRRTHVKWLSREIQQGRWRLTHQAVAISASGRLLDGHHRLNAIIDAQQAVPLLVMRGLDDETWDAIDCGATRSAADRLEFIPESGPAINRRAATLATQLTYVGHASRKKPTNQELEGAFREHEAGIRLVLRTWPKACPPLTAPTVLLPVIRGHTRDPQAMGRFIAAMANRSDADQRHGQLLRVRLLDQHARRRAGYKLPLGWMQQLSQHLVDACLADDPATVPAEMDP